MSGVQGIAQTQAGRLLCVLFLRQRAVPADPDGASNGGAGMLQLMKIETH